MKLLKAVPSPIRINSRALQQSYSVNAFKMPHSSVRKAEISFPVDLWIFLNDSFLKSIPSLTFKLFSVRAMDLQRVQRETSSHSLSFLSMVKIERESACESIEHPSHWILRQFLKLESYFYETIKHDTGPFPILIVSPWMNYLFPDLFSWISRGEHLIHGRHLKKPGEIALCSFKPGVHLGKILKLKIFFWFFSPFPFLFLPYLPPPHIPWDRVSLSSGSSLELTV